MRLLVLLLLLGFSTPALATYECWPSAVEAGFCTCGPDGGGYMHYDRCERLPGAAWLVTWPTHLPKAEYKCRETKTEWICERR